jgi:hypothetical protein
MIEFILKGLFMSLIMGLSKKKCYTMMGGDCPFWLPFFLTVKKKEGPFSKFKPFFEFKKKKSKNLAFSKTIICTHI